jgi:regulatory protein
MLDSAIAQFERMGLLNDAAYLSGMINSLRRRGLSTQAILSRLGQKGLPQDRVLEALRSHDEDSGMANADLAAAVLLTRRKKIGAYRRDTDFDRNKELAALARAGFGFDIAQKALGLSQDEAEDIIVGTRL